MYQSVLLYFLPSKSDYIFLDKKTHLLYYSNVYHDYNILSSYTMALWLISFKHINTIHFIFSPVAQNQICHPLLPTVVCIFFFKDVLEKISFNTFFHCFQSYSAMFINLLLYNYVFIYLYKICFIFVLLAARRNCFLLQSVTSPHRYFHQSSLCSCSLKLAVDRLVIYNCVPMII